MIFTTIVTVFVVALGAARAATLNDRDAQALSTPISPTILFSRGTSTGVTSGTVQVYSADGKNVACLLTKGTMSQQTCAKFTSTASGFLGSSIVLKTRQGLCGIDATSGTFSCGEGITNGTAFTWTVPLLEFGHQLLYYNKNDLFSADATPSGSKQETIFAGTASANTTLRLVYIP